MRLSAHQRLYIIPLLTDFTGSLFIFTLTRYLAEHDSNPAHLGILGTCGSLSYALSAAAFGHLSDHVGHRRLIAIGSLLFCGTFFLALHTLSVPFIFVWSVLASMAMALIHPPMIALLTAGQVSGDHGRSATRPLILFCLSWNLGIICGQASGGTLFALDPSLNLIVGIGSTLAVFFLILTTRTPAPASPPEPAQLRVAPPTQPVVVLRFFAAAGWVANISAACSMSLLYYIFPQLVTHLGISAPAHGLMLTTIRVGTVGLYLLLHYTSFWRHRLLPGLVTQGIAILGMLLLSRGTQIPVLTAGVMCVGVMMGYNYFSGIFYSTTSFAGRRKGLTSGIHETTLALGFVAGSAGGGYLSLHWGMRAPYQACIGILLGSMLLQSLGFLWVRQQRRRSEAMAASDRDTTSAPTPGGADPGEQAVISPSP